MSPSFVRSYRCERTAPAPIRHLLAYACGQAFSSRPAKHMAGPRGVGVG